MLLKGQPMHHAKSPEVSRIYHSPFFAVGTVRNIDKAGLSVPKMIALAKVMESFLGSVHKAGSPDPG